ncbi:bestrophin family protein [Paludibaculum fermentans]|uniref:bestrophin family protein n=1 Tax=Paludibaculum fermentans TaxID=1473598 RepID=UPI003EB81D30
MLVQNRPDWSQVLWQIRKPLAFDIGFALLISVTQEYHWFSIPAAPGTTVSLIGAGLGMILGFRTNSAYQRWWEARILWGELVNSSRTLARQVLAYTPERRVAERVIFGQIAFVHALRCHLRGEDPSIELPGRLAPEEIPPVTAQSNIPSALLQIMQRRITAAADSGYLSEFRLSLLDQTLRTLTSTLGGCERIKNTPLPRQYDYFPEIFIYLYCLIVPLSIVQDVGLMTPVFTGVVAFIFLALNRIGKNLEDPFDSVVYGTPMLAISRTIEINLLEQLGEARIPAAVVATDGVLT